MARSLMTIPRLFLILVPPDITIEEFGKSMEDLITFREVERQMY